MSTPHSFKKISGFTVVELAIVIAVIAILVAITTVIYGNTQRDAADRSVQSDLVAISGLLSSYVSKNGEAKSWYSPNGIDSELSFTPSSGNIIDVTARGEDFCVRGYNPRGTKNSITDSFQRGSNDQACVLMDRSTAAGGSGGTIVGWWKLNNDDGRDYSGFGNTATTVSNVTATTGQNGRATYAYTFNGTNSQLVIPNSASINISGPLSVSAWMRPTDLTGSRGVVTKDIPGTPVTNPPYNIQLNSETSVAYITTGTGDANAVSCGETPLVLNQWAHVTSTYDGSTMRIYVNGVKCSAETASPPSASTTTTLRIGQQKNGMNRWFAGDIDDVRVYNYALTSGDIQEMYTKGAQ